MNESLYNWPQVPGLCHWRRAGGKNLQLLGKGVNGPPLQSNLARERGVDWKRRKSS